MRRKRLWDKKQMKLGKELLGKIMNKNKKFKKKESMKTQYMNKSYI